MGSMNREQQPTGAQYTCREYRQEMILLALRQKLQRRDLSADERQKLAREIACLEKEIGF